MKAQAKSLKDAIVALGVPRRAIRAVSGMSYTVAVVDDPQYYQTVIDHADQLVDPHTGVVIHRYPCGTVARLRVTTDGPNRGRVTWHTYEHHSDNCCDDPPTPR